MKLTKSIREQIISNILIAKFNEPLEKANDLVLQQAEKEVQDRGQGYPFDAVRPYIRYTKRVYLYHRGSRISLAGQFAIYITNEYPKYRDEDSAINLNASDLLNAHVEAYNKIIEEKDALKTSLESIVNSCTTKNALLALAPELDPYIPEIQGTTSLVSLETLATVRKALQ